MRERSLQSEPASSMQDEGGASPAGAATRDVWHGSGDRRPRRSATLRVLGLVSAGLLACCWAGPAAAERVIVLAAASTAHVIDEVIERFDVGPEDRVVASYAGTSALARQIESGAPADIFLAANAAWMDHVEAQGLIEPGSRQVLAGNRLVFVTGQRHGALRALGGARSSWRCLTAGGSPSATPTTCRPASTRARHWKRSASGPACGATSRRRPTCGPRSRWWRRGEAPLGIVYATDAARIEGRACRGNDPGGTARAHRLSGGPGRGTAPRRSRRASSNSSRDRKAGRPSPAPASSWTEGPGEWR